jgi:hypothetical protein
MKMPERFMETFYLDHILCHVLFPFYDILYSSTAFLSNLSMMDLVMNAQLLMSPVHSRSWR